MSKSEIRDKKMLLNQKNYGGYNFSKRVKAVRSPLG
jgi:hypothetical protein|nr:MAG TPA: hypothetical protein [Caudoviricetes sp.]